MLERRRHRRPGDGHQPQPRRGKGRVRLARPVEHLGHHRGHAGEDGDAFLAQHAGGFGRREARREHQRRAGAEVAHELGGEADDVRHRQDTVADVVARHATHARGAGGREHHVGVGQHHALGRAGGARGVEHAAHLFARIVEAGFGSSALVQRADRNLAEAGPIQVLGAVARGVACGFRRHVRRVQHPARLRVFDEEVDLALGQPGVGHHDPDIEPAGGQHPHAQRHAVLAHHQQPVARTQAECLQLPGRGHRRIVQFAIAQRGKGITQRGRVGLLGHPRVHQLMDACRGAIGCTGHASLLLSGPSYFAPWPLVDATTIIA